MAKPEKVQLFVTCMIEALRPEAGLAVVSVLEALGLEVIVPEGQTCCGQPAFNGGLWEDARPLARHTLDVLSQSGAPIVVPSGSCADMIKHHYAELLADDPQYAQLAKDIAARTYEFAQFLVDVLGVTNLNAYFKGKITYHPSCHLLRGLGIDHQPHELLKHVQDLEVVDLPNATECCGFGGLFAIKMGDISSAMLQRKLDAIESTGAHAVVGCDVSCLINIGGGLHRRGSQIETKYIAEILLDTDKRG
ncbi:MAG TPA: (Fe-S)-binding protein [Anaerolineae bacterium]|nr:(Fe-S)-binding protein [Anaerolineae bacterium]